MDSIRKNLSIERGVVFIVVQISEVFTISDRYPVISTAMGIEPDIEVVKSELSMP